MSCCQGPAYGLRNEPFEYEILVWALVTFPSLHMSDAKLLRAVRGLEADFTRKSQRALEKALHLGIMAVLLCNPEKGSATSTVSTVTRSTPLQKTVPVVDCSTASSRWEATVSC